MKREDGKILKPIQPPPKGPREAQFYLDINRSSHPADILIRNHIPKFYGLEQVGFTNGITVTEDFIVLEDITEGYALPSVMDIKIGSQTWGPDASEAKIASESAKYKGTKGPLGFSILGMIVHPLDPSLTCPQKFDKSFGKDLKTHQVQKVPEIFFAFDQGSCSALVKIMLDKMLVIREVFEMQRKYKIYASSLLLAYDSAAVRAFRSGKIGLEKLGQSVDIRLIDFAHVFDADGQRDDNFLKGLNNLIAIFEAFLQRLY